jgi:hypothetical protein
MVNFCWFVSVFDATVTWWMRKGTKDESGISKIGWMKESMVFSVYSKALCMVRDHLKIHVMPEKKKPLCQKSLGFFEGGSGVWRETKQFLLFWHRMHFEMAPYQYFECL